MNLFFFVFLGESACVRNREVIFWLAKKPFKFHTDHFLSPKMFWKKKSHNDNDDGFLLQPNSTLRKEEEEGKKLFLGGRGNGWVLHIKVLITRYLASEVQAT